MIISLRSISYEELKSQLTENDRIVIMSCNTCVVSCGIAGNGPMTTLEGMLKADGFNVLGKDLCSCGCTLNIVEGHRADRKKREMYEEATVIIPLICENGLEVIKSVFYDKKVISMSKTLGTGNFTMDRGVVLTNPLESTGLEKSDEGYDLYELAEKLDLYSDFFDEDDAAPQEKDYVNLTINGEEVMAENGQNLLEVCGENGIFVPHLCYDEELSNAGVCRLCLVKVEGMRGLIPSCCTTVKDGMVIVTEDAELIACRRVILELVLASNSHNCLTCSKGLPNLMASCELQSLMRRYGIEGSRYDENTEKVGVDDSSPIINYDADRCILCGRCVRACDELAGLRNIGFINRGSQTIVAAGLNTTMNQSACAACMACVNACPTGALTEKYLHFEGKDWEPAKVYSDCLE